MNCRRVKSELNSSMCLKTPGTSGGKANDKDKDDRQNWDFKQDIRYLEEGIVGENKHFEEWVREEAECVEECHREAEGRMHHKIITVTTVKQSLSVVGECIVEHSKNKNHQKGADSERN